MFHTITEAPEEVVAEGEADLQQLVRADVVARKHTAQVLP